jgi:hypothetical protein
LKATPPLLQTRLLLLSLCASSHYFFKVYAEHYAARAAAFRGHHHIGNLLELPHTIFDPAVPLLVAFYDPR